MLEVIFTDRFTHTSYRNEDSIKVENFDNWDEFLKYIVSETIIHKNIYPNINLNSIINEDRREKIIDRIEKESKKAANSISKDMDRYILNKVPFKIDNTSYKFGLYPTNDLHHELIIHSIRNEKGGIHFSNGKFTCNVEHASLEFIESMLRLRTKLIQIYVKPKEYFDFID